MSGPASRALLPPFVAAAVLACGVVLLRFAVQGRTGLNPADEGFFWYGVQRVLHGEVPIRDFMAYDIGRYYVSAAGLWLAGDDGVVALRVVVALFQALVLALVLRAAMGWERRWPVLLAIALVLALWMWHWFRIFDYAASLLLFCAAAWLAAAPGPRRALVAGVVLGAVATIGRNHGVYGAFGLAVVALAAQNSSSDAA